MLKAYVKYALIVAMCFSIATPLFAEEIPVFEIEGDRYPPNFDNNSESYQNEGSQQASHANSATRSLTFQQRLSRIEQKMNNLQQSNSSSKIDSLQREVQALRSQIEELNHVLQQVQSQQSSMYTDLDNRLTQLKSKPVAQTNMADSQKSKETAESTPSKTSSQTPTTSSSVTPTATNKLNQPNPAEEQHIYQTAYDLIKSKKYNEAILTLQKMLQKYPSGQFAANAHFWLGELYGLLNKNDQSAEEFATVVKNYPESPKVADAQLKLGLIYMAQFRWNDAKAAFKKVVTIAPGTATSRLATEQLRQIKKAGH